MPSVLGSGFTKAMGPLMMAIGLGAAPFTGGATLPLAMGGLTQSMGQGGVLGPTTPTMPSLTPPHSSAAAAPMVSPSLPTPAGAGLSMTAPGAGTTPSAGAGTGDYGNQIASNLLSSANPFAAYAA